MSTQGRLKKRACVESDDEYDSPPQTQTQRSTQTQRVKTAREEPNWDEEEIRRKIKDIVRYALACEFKRKPMRREEISKIVADNSRKANYNMVLDKARFKLNKVFGMEISELPTLKERFNQSQTQMKNAEGRAGESSTQAAQTQRSGTSGTYILRYNMKEAYRTPDIIEQSEQDYKHTGILYVILGLIFLNGQTMTSSVLYEHLDRLKITKSRSEFDDRDKLIDSFIRNNYLKKTRRPETAGEDLEYDFTHGPRAKLELPSQNIVNFLLSFYNVSQTEKLVMEQKMYRQAGFQMASSNKEGEDTQAV